MSTNGEVVETGTLAEQAHQRLEELIVTLALAPGSVWSEASLAERLEIGRTPVREAAQRLEAAHLLEIVPRHGIMITTPNIHEQLLVLETRRELERLIAQRAARRALPNEREQMRAAAATLRAAGESGDVLAYLRRLIQVGDVERLVAVLVVVSLYPSVPVAVPVTVIALCVLRYSPL